MLPFDESQISFLLHFFILIFFGSGTQGMILAAMPQSRTGKDKKAIYCHFLSLFRITSETRISMQQGYMDLEKDLANTFRLKNNR